MWHKEIELERMGCLSSGWAYQQRRGRNKQMKGKKLTLSTQRLSFHKENVRNVKHSDMFTYLPVIHIFRLRLRPDVRQIPSYPRGMVWPNLPQSMWPRLESTGGKGKGGMCVCVCVCVCFAFQAAKCECCLKQLNFTRLFFYTWDKKATIWRKGCHMKYFQEVNCGIILSSSLVQRASEEETNTLRSIRGRHGPTICIYDITVTAEITAPVHYVLWYNNTLSQHINVQGIDWNIIESTTQASNCNIILLQHTARPVALDLKGLMCSRASL